MKCASILKISLKDPKRLKNTVFYINTLYTQNVTFGEFLGKLAKLIKTFLTSFRGNKFIFSESRHIKYKAHNPNLCQKNRDRYIIGVPITFIRDISRKCYTNKAMNIFCKLSDLVSSNKLCVVLRKKYTLRLLVLVLFVDLPGEIP